MQQNPIRWFGGANSEHGFVSYYGDLYSGLKYIYILKGGPGTGKSYLMRLCAERAREYGYKPEEIYCSSDSTSLDGVIVRECGFGILDGTAPHTVDPDEPAISGEIYNLGAFWNRDEIQSHDQEISKLCAQKSCCYQSVYSLCKAYGELTENTDRAVLSSLMTDKIDAAVKRFATRYMTGVGSKFSMQTRQISSVGMWGKTVLPTFRDLAKVKINVSDAFESGYLFLHAIKEIARQRNLPVMVSYHPVCSWREEALFFPSLKMSIDVFPSDGTEDKIINMKRFLDKNILSEHKNILRFNNKLRDSVMLGIYDLFKSIRLTHFEIETFYTNAMSFSDKSRAEKAFIDRIFSHAGVAN